MFKNIFRIFTVMLITTLIVLGVQLYSNFEFIKKRSLETIANKPSMVGDYLSARYAHRNNQMQEAYGYYASALKKDPKNTELIKSIYLLMISMGNIDSAKKFIDEHYTYKKFDEMTIAMKSILALKSKDYELAYQYAIEGIKTVGKYKNNEIVLILLPSLEVLSLAGQGKFEDSLAVLNELDDPRLEQYVIFQKARIYSMMGNLKEATKLFDRVIAESKTFNNMITAASFFNKLGQVDKVQNIIEEYNSIEPSIRLTKKMIISNDSFYNSLDSIISGVLQEQAAFVSIVGRVSDAIIYSRLSLYVSPEPDYNILLLTRLFESQKLYKESINLYELIPNSSSYYINALMGKALVMAKIGNIEEAEKVLKEVVKNKEYFEDAYLRLGDILIADKQYKNAAIAYSKIIDRISKKQSNLSTEWSVYYARGICYDKIGRWEDAENDFITALEFSPREASVLNYLAYSWLMKDKNLEEAKRMLKIALQQKPGDAHIIDSYGWALYKNGDNVGAMNFIEKATLMLPHDSVTNDHLGDVYWAVNRKTEALYQWERALELNPEPKDKERIQQKISDIFKKRFSFINEGIKNYK